MANDLRMVTVTMPVRLAELLKDFLQLPSMQLQNIPDDELFTPEGQLRLKLGILGNHHCKHFEDALEAARQALIARYAND